MSRLDTIGTYKRIEVLLSWTVRDHYRNMSHLQLLPTLSKHHLNATKYRKLNVRVNLCTDRNYPDVRLIELFDAYSL